MIEALKQSNEDKHLVVLAKKYVYGIKGDLAQRERRKSRKGPAADASINSTKTPTSSVPPKASILPARQPVIDLTEDQYESSNGQPAPSGREGSNTNDQKRIAC